MEPLGRDRTRLIARGGVRRGIGAAAYGMLMEIPHFLMERRMLLGIKQRAEASRGSAGQALHVGGFVLNRAINPLVRWLLRSPLHRLASRRIALITYTGRRSGHRYTIPVGYEMAGVDVTIPVGSADRKLWWRSLTGTGAIVELVLRGQRRTGHAIATRAGDHAFVRVALDH